MNKVLLIGRLCADAKLDTVGENKYARFTLAVNRDYKAEEGKRNADFVSCVAWNNTAENISKYFHKGSRIGLTGRLQTGDYEKQDGTKVYTTDVIVEKFDFLDNKNDSRPAPEYVGPEVQKEEGPAPTPQEEDDAFAQFAAEADFSGLNENEVILDPSQLPF